MSVEMRTIELPDKTIRTLKTILENVHGDKWEMQAVIEDGTVRIALHFELGQPGKDGKPRRWDYAFDKTYLRREFDERRLAADLRESQLDGLAELVEQVRAERYA
ncbi:hypothetical protein [Kyrpidia sp.]|uniref:hypothetical protein n=1 Tax=Kyrpidia sp. TaxID=2073077 RepID=UPI002585F83C|nr:hypothetical protein [Kyrpidia sp.]MCL6577485.1 hypothetical protein [Kyrpidia sp.]